MTDYGFRTPPALMDYHEAGHYVGYSHQHLRRLVKDNKFPSPVRISSNRHLFRGEDVKAWLDDWLRPRAGYTKHGMTYTGLYKLWRKLYDFDVVEEWKDPAVFLEWAAEHAKPDMVLIHKDRSKPIGPENAFFGTNTQKYIVAGTQRNNTSGRRGVSFNKKLGSWNAYIKIQGKRIHLGYYDNFDDAVEARERGEDKFFKPLMESVKI